jgi:hypothetical protein
VSPGRGAIALNVEKSRIAANSTCGRKRPQLDDFQAIFTAFLQRSTHMDATAGYPI